MPGSDLVVPGIRLGVASANIKQADRSDLLVIELAEGGRCAAVFTRNAFCAAPVQLAKAHLQSTVPRYLLINSGNANAGTGERGMRDAEACCRSLAQSAGCRPEQVLPFSTGVIGVNLPLDRMCRALPAALADLQDAGWQAAAQAIMTTDTRPKLVQREFEVDGVKAHLVGIAKGAGMICPDMATMLAYLATDLTVDAALLQRCLNEAVDPSFNSITVDGDTSTNDACVLLASGASAAPPITSRESDAYRSLAAAVTSLCMELAREIVRDGEGATKLVEVAVEQAVDRAEARQLAYTIAHSPLVKTALFASDPNWGRILAAVGRAGLQRLEIERVEIWLDDICIVRGGGRAEGYTEAEGQAVMDKPEFRILVRLGRGEVQARLLTCDLSYDYVKINAEYRT
ncbi:MAG: bifunctional glutamate N-acetyltransferase/amino-acid acetyltransferase ArgJ [Candidatus Thiodiazotropha sp.]